MGALGQRYEQVQRLHDKESHHRPKKASALLTQELG